MDSPVTFITGNPSKAEQLSKYLGLPVTHKKIDLVEVQSLDLPEIIIHKAKEAYKHVNTPVIVDDVSLLIIPMGKLPGPFIKFFIKELGNEGICSLISQFKDRSAQAEVCIGYFDGEKLELFSGITEGTISAIPKGSGGFGWDAIFIPEGYKQTRAEMSDTDYDDTSPRKIALEKLNAFFRKGK